MKRVILFLVCSFLIPVLLAGCGTQEEVPPPEPQQPQDMLTDALPQEIRPGARYIFYLHGQIVEDSGVRPTPSRFGVYDYEAIVDTLTARGFVVISEARGKDTDVWAYADKTRAQIEALIGAGVPPEHICVVGHSKGGAIAIMTTSLLKNDRVSFVFLACCGDWMAERPQIDLHGRILSIYDASDDFTGSCQKAFDSTTHPLVTREIVLHTELGHGAFYRPIPEWVEPVVAWVRGMGIGD
jgi:hypothetical protein